MNHKELCLFFRLPVPLCILHIYSVFEEIDESVYDYLSEALTRMVMKQTVIETEITCLIDKLTRSGADHHPDGIVRGFSFLLNFIQHELLLAVRYEDLRQLQAIHVIDPDTVVVTFFSNGKDSLYASLRRRT